MKYYLLLLLLGTTLFAFSQDDSLTVHGELKGQGNLKVMLSFSNDDGKTSSYVSGAKNDKFSFKVKKQSQPVVARFNTFLNRNLSKTIDGKNYGNPAPALDLFIYKTDLEIVGTAADIQVASVNGDKENNEFAAYKKSTEQFEKRRWETSKALFFMDMIKDSLSYNKLMAALNVDGKKQWQLLKNFIKMHPASFGSLFLLSRSENLYTTDDFQSAYAGLSDIYKNTVVAQKIAKRIEFLSPTAVGKPAVNFIKKDKDGNEINLAAYKGKMVLLDFWGSWCGPCRASNPHLKELYSEYRNKGFEIIGIAAEKAKTAEERRSNWLGAIEKDGIGWVHILNNEEQVNQDLVTDYRITGFPTKILLDKDGKILLRVTASATDDIDKALEKYLGK